MDTPAGPCGLLAQIVLLVLELFEGHHADIRLVVWDGFAVDPCGLVGAGGRSGPDLWSL